MYSITAVSDGVNNFLNSFKLVHTTITTTIKGEDNTACNCLSTIIPANQHSKIDYIDIVWINTMYIYIYIRPYDPDFNPLDVVYTVNFTVDVYDLY